MYPSDDYSYLALTKGSTGSEFDAQGHKLVVVPYHNFEVIVCLTEDNRFLGITELRIKKDFLSPDQKVANSGVFDVDEFYQE